MFLFQTIEDPLDRKSLFLFEELTFFLRLWMHAPTPVAFACHLWKRVLGYEEKKKVVSVTPRPHQVRKEAHFWLFPAITRCDGWRSDLFCGTYRKRRETQKQLKIRKKKENGGGARERSIPGTSGSFGPKGRYHFRELGSKETWHWIRTPRSLDDKKKMKRGQPSKTRVQEKKKESLMQPTICLLRRATTVDGHKPVKCRVKTLL